MNQLRQKHIPQRTCIGCGQVQPKRQLIRVVRTASGKVEVDPTGKKSGRGAYVCNKRECWEKALAKSVLNRTLKVEIDSENREELLRYANRLGDKSTTQSAPEAEGKTGS
jgi:predicted RNA-binding protein YlxR (DUF448 family)